MSADLERTVARCRGGDDDAWRALVDATAGPIWRLCTSYAPTAAEAEELMQEVYLKLWQNLDRYRPGSNFVAWACRVARNLLVDAYRRARAERSQAWLDPGVLERLPADDDPHAAAERRQRLRLVVRALHRLDPELAELVLLRDFAGLAYAEIADALGLPLGTVKSRLNRARLELAEEVRRRLALRLVGGTVAGGEAGP